MMNLGRYLFALSLLVLANNACAEVFCVDNATTFQNALATTASNGQDDEVRIVQGTYVGNFVYATASEAYDLAVSGGYATGCASQVINPAKASSSSPHPFSPSMALATPAVAANTESADVIPLTSAPTADASSTTGAEVLHAAGARLQRGYGQLPMRFEPNQGQADAAAKFLARGPGYQLFLTDEEAVLVLRQAQPARPKDKLLARRELTPAPAGGPRPHLGEGTASTTEPPSAPGTPQPVAGSAPDTQALAQTPPAVIRMRLEGTNRNPAPALTGQEHLPGYSNYFIGKDPAQWRTRVPHYGKVRYSEVYPGIDLVYYGNPQQLEYDFVLAPGADPGLIQLSYSGIERLEIDEAGDLLLHVPGGRLVQQAPRLYNSSMASASR